MLSDRTFKTIEEMIDTLVEKGVVIEDKDFVRKFLLENNYHFVTSYRDTFKNKDRTYIEGTTFMDIHNLYMFDRKLRMVIFEVLLEIEQKVKTITMYHFSSKYGYKEKDYTTARYFDQQNPNLKSMLNTLNIQLSRNSKNDKEALSSLKEYGYIPFWIGIKIFTFGIVSDFIGCLRKEDQEQICILSSKKKQSTYQFILNLELLVYLRNMCAHDEELYNFNEFNHTLYSSLQMIQSFISKERYEELMNEILQNVEIYTKDSHHLTKKLLLESMHFPYKDE